MKATFFCLLSFFLLMWSHLISQELSISKYTGQQNKTNFETSGHLDVNLSSFQSEIPLNNKRIEILSAFDMDSDGSDELLALTNNDSVPYIGQLFVYKWNGSNFDTLWQSLEMEYYPYGIKIADLDNDSLTDVLISCGGLKFFKNTGDSLSNQGNIIPYMPDNNFVAEDLNGDSLIDIATGLPGMPGGYVRLYQQAPFTFNFNFVGELSGGTIGANMLKAFDMKNDGNLDLLNGEIYSGDVYVYKNNDDFNFSQSFSHQFNTRILSLETADFNNDGFVDFIVAEAWACIHFFKNIGDENFQIVHSGSNIGSAMNTSAYDMDKDNHIDLLAATFEGQIYQFRNLGDFQFEEKLCSSSASAIYGFTVADFDGNGIPDMAFGVDPIVIVFDAPGSFVSTSVKENKDFVSPNQFTLLQNYPNPFNPETTIRFELPKREMVTLKVYDITGKEITTLVYEELPAGRHSVVFNGEDLASGVYFVSFQALGFSQSRKMLLLK